MDGTEKRPPILGFSFIQLIGLYIRQPFEINLPVHAGEETKAQEIAGVLLEKSR